MRIKLSSLVIAAFFLITGAAAASFGAQKVTLEFFWGEGCPHCEEAKPFVEELQKRHPDLSVRSFEVFVDEENLELLRKTARQHGVEARGVPMFFVGGRAFSGFSKETAGKIEAEVTRQGSASPDFLSPRQTRLEVPFFGALDAASLSLPVLTVVVAGLDSFNPCAFFVLFFLLSLLIHAHSRRKMLVVGGIFVLFSGAVYFLFMAAWLNFFLLFGGVRSITVIAGAVAAAIALINIKDFFLFKKGVSFTIPERAKPKLFGRMREMIQVSSLPGMLVATVILSVTANAYEVVCTAGFPMIYTRTLTLHHLPRAVYYCYLALYNAVYVLPLLCIVVFFVITLGSRRLSEWQGRILKLLSGIMMLGLAGILLTRPSLLNNAVTSLILLACTIAVTAAVVLAAKRFGLHRPHP